MTIEIVNALEKNINNPELLNTIAVLADSLVQKNITNGSWAQNSSLTQSVKLNNKPLRDKGLLLTSITHRVLFGSIIVGSNHPAAEILNNGGVITPKNSKALAVPAGPQTMAFMRTYGLTPKACIEGMKATGYVFWYAKNVLMTQKGKRGKPHALFIMRKSITIPARPFMQLPPESIKILEKAVCRRIFL